MKWTILLFFFCLPILLLAQSEGTLDDDSPVINEATAGDAEEIILASSWKIQNSSNIYPFWMAVVPRGAWDFEETITAEQWNEALQGQNEIYILWPGDAQKGDWSNGNVIIGGFWTPELSAYKAGFLVQEDFTEEWIALDETYWESVTEVRGENLLEVIPQWVDPPLTLDGRVDEWSGLPFVVQGGEQGITTMKSTFWGEWLALYAEAEGEISQSIFLKLASRGEALGIIELPITLAQGPVLLWLQDGEGYERVGSFVSRGSDFEFLLQWARIKAYLQLGPVFTVDLHLINGNEAPYIDRATGRISLN
jgi:hypothetical protein